MESENQQLSTQKRSISSLDFLSELKELTLHMVSKANVLGGCSSFFGYLQTYYGEDKSGTLSMIIYALS